MQEDDTVLSEVHILDGARRNRSLVGDVSYKTLGNSNNYSSVKLALSRFPFSRSLDETSMTIGNDGELSQLQAYKFDEDGDLDVQRRPTGVETISFDSDVITLEHGLASPLRLVGLQVWLGALLLSDYILSLGNELFGSTVLELGAGTGLCSIVASIFTERVICTDVGKEILSVCQRNVNRNKHLVHGSRSILVRELDWKDGFPPPWSLQEDLSVINDCDIILAADVIYDDQLTDSFFALLKNLLVTNVRPKGRTLYLSMEKRLNFTLSALDISCPAYNHFLTKIEDLRKFDVNITKLPTNFCQRFSYKRSKYLELWKMSSNGNAMEKL